MKIVDVDQDSQPCGHLVAFLPTSEASSWDLAGLLLGDQRSAFLPSTGYGASFSYSAEATLVSSMLPVLHQV